MSFYQKYRSNTFGEMIGQEHITKTLLESIKSDRYVHAYLLTGPRGIGKTSTARLLAKALNCETVIAAKKAHKETSGEPCNKCQSCQEIAQGMAVDVVEIDAASHTGVDNIREIIEKSRLLPVRLTKKVYIIDEVHMLSKGAFNALLKTLEEPPEHIVFILATTEIQKIPATILSRAQRYDFKRAQKAEIKENLTRVAKTEKIKIDDESLDIIAVLAGGAHRDALSLLEQVSSFSHDIDADMTRKILGIVESEILQKFVEAIFSANPEEGLKIAHKLYDDGRDLSSFCHQVIEYLRQILILKMTGKSLFSQTEEEIKVMSEISGNISSEKIVKLMEIFVESTGLYRDVTDPILPLEMAVIKGVSELQSDRVSELYSEKVANLPSKKVTELPSDRVAEKPLKNSATQQPSNSEALKPRNSETLKPNSPETPKLSNSETVDVPVLCMTKDLWEQIISKTKSQNATLAALLRDAKPEGMTDNALTICVKFKFHKDRISEAKHAEILNQIVSEVVGENCRVVCKISDKKNQAPVEQNNDLAKMASEVFETE